MSKTRTLKKLAKDVFAVYSEAEFFAYATSSQIRDSVDWSGFRQSAEADSRLFPSLRPILGRITLCLDALQACRAPVLSRSTPSRVLFSDANPCHAHFCELNKEVEVFKKEFSRLLAKLL
jgi:hypothetical protein